MAETFDVTNPLANILPTNNTPAYVPPGNDTTGAPVNPITPSATVPPIGAQTSQPSAPGLPQVGTGSSQPTAPTPPRPMSFAAKLLSAVGDVLKSANQIGVQGFANGGNPQAQAIVAKQQEQARYNAQQAKEAQARQDNLTQEQRIQQREDDEAHARIALMNTQKATATQQDYRMGQEWMDKQVAEDKQHLKDIIGDGIHSPVQSGVTGDQLHQLLQDNKLNPYEYSYFKTGLKDDGVDANGNPKQAYTYDVLKVPQSMPLTDSMIERMKTVPGYKELQKGTNMSGSQILSVLQQAKTMETTEEGNRKQLSEAGIERSKEDQAASELELTKSGDWLKALQANNGSMVNAAASILHDPNMIKKYGGALYNDVMYQFHGDKDDTGIKGYTTMLDKQKEIDEKAQAAQDKKDQALTFQGTPGLSGDAYLNSLQNPREKQLVKEAGDGRMDASNLSALMRGKNGKEFTEALAQYAPDFQGDKVPAFYKAVREYNDDKAGGVGGQLIAAGTALRGLRKLYDDTNKWSLVPTTEEAKARENDIATVANEVAKFNAAGRQPGERDVADVKESLDPKIAGIVNPINRRVAVKNQVELMTKKIQEMEDDWAQKAPSPRYISPMPNISAQSRIDSAYVLNNGKYAVPRGAQSFTNPQTNHQVFTFDGKQYFDASNGQPVNFGAK